MGIRYKARAETLTRATVEEQRRREVNANATDAAPNPHKKYLLPTQRQTAASRRQTETETEEAGEKRQTMSGETKTETGEWTHTKHTQRVLCFVCGCVFAY